ncbi:hypothetical protein DAPPUDRAFT_237316 [Daphnia pulex]|uniref:Uncharacterized protein n=1 Tax=Daphnia pulex TaxID=6669 RepID=E9G3L8_DAPPU|nr:hypothetical protein DAPPUDRAFT_237316 [Daphnia pulex]|eukprot:EFX85964.1 hypothetical protein DAPPUDRAFT_237316 [Daphnia pulex]
MNSDDEDRDSSNRDTSSMSDEESDTDIATVLTQLIRRGLICTYQHPYHQESSSTAANPIPLV